MSILFYGDPHGDFAPLMGALRAHGAEHVVVVGDLGLDAPLRVALAGVLETGACLHWIHGNHDTPTPRVHDFLFGEPGSLHLRVERMACSGASPRVGGLGGHYKGRVWHPRQGGEAARWDSPEEFVAAQAHGGLFRGGLPLVHRCTVFPSHHRTLAGLGGTDVLVTHEAPGCAPDSMGFGALDDLARDCGARLLVHGHLHVPYRSRTRHGTQVLGLGRAEPVRVDARTLEIIED